MYRRRIVFCRRIQNSDVIWCKSGIRRKWYLCGIAGKEAAAVGCNWAFSPIYPITNVRTFGSKQERVINFVKEQLKGLRDNGVAAAVKHFPGDGVDERDQHLVASVNSLSVEE